MPEPKYRTTGAARNRRDALAGGQGPAAATARHHGGRGGAGAGGLRQLLPARQAAPRRRPQDLRRERDRDYVHFWARQATDGPAKALVAEFNRTHKKLKVVLHLTPPNDDTSQLATAIRAGDPPDAGRPGADIDVPTFSHENALLDITKYVNALPYKSALSPGHLALATIGSKYYGVPYLADLSVLWYNKTLFKRAGLKPRATRRPTTTRRSSRTPRRSARWATASTVSPSLGNAARAAWASPCCPRCGPTARAPDQRPSSAPQKANVTSDAPLKTMLAAYRTMWAKDKLVPLNDQTQNGLTWGADFEGEQGRHPARRLRHPRPSSPQPAQKAEFAASTRR